jgi:hypothetical protein
MTWATVPMVWAGGLRKLVTQELLIKMVRRLIAPTLRWLRSDLTQENIVLLQQERPGITFVSE